MASNQGPSRGKTSPKTSPKLKPKSSSVSFKPTVQSEDTTKGGDKKSIERMKRRKGTKFRMSMF